jgi:chloramphenicol-sensitive protein RarD
VGAPTASEPRWVGGVYATAAFGTWGLAPLYWRAVRDVPGLELVAHRIVWSVPFLLLLVAARRRLRDVAAALRDRRHVLVLAGTAVLVAANWLVFVLAIQAGRVLDASLGYYVNPLLMVLLGVVFLGERLTRLQGAAVALAGAGVAWLTVASGAVPWIPLLLATTFGFYGLVRKRVRVEALAGLAVETLLLCPVAGGALLVLAARGEGGLARGDAGHDLLLVASGVVTALPLLWFANAARRLRYTTVGFFQYLAPTGQLLLAVLAFGEPFTRDHAVTFSLIGAAVALYVADGVRAARRVPARP